MYVVIAGAVVAGASIHAAKSNLFGFIKGDMESLQTVQIIKSDGTSV